MKTVLYYDQEYTVPDWVNFIATDKNGETFGYRMEPELREAWWCQAKGTRMYHVVGYIRYQGIFDWAHSCVEV
jgi:hypothetical protein